MKARFLSVVAALCFVGSISKAASAVQTSTAGPKMDILFVIDNSGTMESAVTDLIANLPAFLAKVKNSNLDFHIGVTTTDAYLNAYGPRFKDFAKLRDGSDGMHSQVFVVTPQTPDLQNVLSINLRQGTKGSGDERAFASFRETLKFAGNSDFRRSDAALSVLVVSDEDDFSHNDLSNDPNNPTKNYYFTENYDDPKMYKVSEFQDFLKSLGGPLPASFSTISVQKPDCQNMMTGSKISRRYNELADMTGGVRGSICEMAMALDQYADFIQKEIPQPEPAEYIIRLDRTPIVETIVVKINGRLISQNSTDGWIYDAATVSLKLHGSAIPEKGQVVSVSYDYEEAL